MPRQFAEGTRVEVGKSLEEIRKLAKAAGATHWTHGEDEDEQKSWVQFRLKGMVVRFTVRLPTLEDDTVRYTPAGNPRPHAQRPAAVEGEARRRWREMALLVKAKLVAVKSGIVTVAEEFLPYVVLDNGETVADYVWPRLTQLQEAARSSIELALLPPLEITEEEEKP